VQNKPTPNAKPFLNRLGADAWPLAMIFLAVALLMSQFGLGVQTTILNNFLNDEMGISSDQFGFMQSIRELPGLFTIALAAVTALITQSLLIAGCMVLISAGLLLFAQSFTFVHLIIATLTLSVGFHLLFPIQSAMVLKLAPKGEKGKRLGQVNSMLAAATLLAMGFVYLTSKFISFRGLFVVAAVAAAVGAAIMIFAPREKVDVAAKRFVFDWKYKTYYILRLLSGSRRHIFQTFATWVLVKAHGTPVQTIALLMITANILSLYTRPLFGGLIDRLGERSSLATNYTFVVAIFLGYGFITYKPLLFTFYIIDHLLLGFDIAITTFLDKIAPEEDIAPSLAMGSTINHIAGVAVPTIGGLLWVSYGYSATFVAGAVIAALSIFFSAGLRVEAPSQQTELPS